MKNLLLAIAFTFIPVAALAETVGGSGTNPASCVVVGDASITLTATGANLLSGTGSGSITQNTDTTYTLSSVTATGPDANLQATTIASGTALSLSSTESVGDNQVVTGEVTETLTYAITLSSSDGALAAGAYTSDAELTCVATP